MSMISAQIDKLRELAGDGSMEWVAGPIRASVLRDAADTIWQLRDDLQRANAAVQDSEHDESMAWDRVRKAEAENAKLLTEFDKMDKWHSAELQAAMAENAKLRELAEDMLDYIEIREAFGRPPTSEMCKEFAQRADELGIEVE